MDLQVPPPRGSKRAPSFLRCCTVLGILIAGVLGIFFTVAVSAGFWKYYKSVADPHKVYHHNDRTQTSLWPVQPLFSDDQLFDVAATVWIQHSAEDLARGVPTGLRVTHEVNETALASQIVLRGVSMKTKNAQSSIGFELPLIHFRQANISFFNLRGAVTLIPVGSSKLDRVQEYSDWRPVEAKPFPRRSNPFPLDLKAPEGSTLSLQDDIIEHYGVSFNLVELWEVESKCKLQDKSEEEADEEDDGSLREEVEIAALPKTPDGTLMHKRHPHIVTRSHVYIVDENRAYNRTSFDKQHSHLKKTSCKPMPDGAPSWKNCFRSYDLNGHREMRLLLDPVEGSKRKEVAYGPFISRVNQGSGPNDVIPLPVNRENCTSWKEGASPSMPDSMDVTWNIHFSGLTPARLHLFENMVSKNRFPFNSTALAKTHIHKEWEQSVALFGQKIHANIRPKRRLVFHTLRQALLLSTYLLEIAYWYTRTTSAGISISGSAFLIASSIVDCIAQTVWTIKEDGFSFFIALAVSALPTFFVCLPMYFAAQVVSPIALKWRSWRSVSLHRAVLTHRERASRRLDATLPLNAKAIIVSSVFALLYTFAYFNFYLLSPSLPRQTDKELGDHFVWRQRIDAISGTLTISGLIFQYHLNHRAQTFGGSFRIATGFIMAAKVLRMVYLAPSIIGHFAASEGFPATEMVNLALEVLACYQAFKLPRVEQLEEEE